MSSETRRRNMNSLDQEDMQELVRDQEDEVTSDEDVDENATINLGEHARPVIKTPLNLRKCPPKYVFDCVHVFTRAFT